MRVFSCNAASMISSITKLCSGKRELMGKWGWRRILAQPHSQFLLRWLEEYRSFHWDVAAPETWNEHSVKLPARLARAYPSEITVLPHTALYWPLWIKEHLDWIFASNRPIPFDQTYANHLWEYAAWKEHLEDLTPGRVPFSRHQLPFLGETTD